MLTDYKASLKTGVLTESYLQLHISPELSFIAPNVVQHDFSASTDVNFLSWRNKR